MQLFEALRHKPKGSRVLSPWALRDFLTYFNLLAHYGPGFDSASNRYEYLESSLGLKTAG